MFVNERWFNPGYVTMKKRMCSLDIELLAVSMLPYHLLREFSSAIFVCVYVPQSADETVACDAIYTTVAQLPSKHLEVITLH